MYKHLLIFGVVLIIVCVLTGCFAPGKNQLTDTGFGLNVHFAQEGVFITFNSLPSYTVRFPIYISNFETE